MVNLNEARVIQVIGLRNDGSTGLLYRSGALWTTHVINATLFTKTEASSFVRSHRLDRYGASVVPLASVAGSCSICGGATKLGLGPGGLDMQCPECDGYVAQFGGK